MAFFMFDHLYPKEPKGVVNIGAPTCAKKPAQQKRGTMNNAGHNCDHQKNANVCIFQVDAQLTSVSSKQILLDELEEYQCGGNEQCCKYDLEDEPC